jgi:hypothetical protein
MSPKESFASLTLENSPNSLEKFWIEHGEQKLVIGSWGDPEPDEEYEGKPVI